MTANVWDSVEEFFDDRGFDFDSIEDARDLFGDAAVRAYLEA